MIYKILLFILTCITMSAQSQAQVSTEELQKFWHDRMFSEQEGLLRVRIYCNDQKSAESKAKNFVISENKEGLVHVTELEDVMPPMPGKLSETTRLRKTFNYLTVEQVEALGASEKQEYLVLEKRMKIYDKFMDYINSLNCFRHNGIRFSMATNYEWLNEMLMDSNLYKAGWKTDVYSADIDMGSKVEKKFIYVGPCRVLPGNPRCLDVIKQAKEEHKKKLEEQQKKK